MKMQIIMNKDTHRIVTNLMNNIDEINSGDEIGGWFTGKYIQEKEFLTLYLDKFYIPKQKVSRAEVDMSPETMLDMIKMVGEDYQDTIVAHWHIHPFNKGSTNWSSIDEDKISDFMDINKGRKKFCFLLSSKDQIKGRMLFRVTTEVEFTGYKETYIKSFDDLEIQIEGETKNEEIVNSLKEIIKEKVTKSVSEWKSDLKSDWKSSFRSDKSKDEKSKEDKKKKKKKEVQEELLVNDNFVLQTTKKGILLKMTPEFADRFRMIIEDDNWSPDSITENTSIVAWFYKCKSESRPELKASLEAMLLDAEDLISDDCTGIIYNDVDREKLEEARYNTSYVPDMNESRFYKHQGD